MINTYTSPIPFGNTIDKPDESSNTTESLAADNSHMLLPLISCIWAIGVFCICIQSYFKLRKLKCKLKTATLVMKKSTDYYKVYETDQISSPFLLGLLRPKIYLPIGLSSQELEYVLSHEKVHIRRKDFILKPIAFTAVALHWMNPLSWLSFYLLSKDMEMACDESVIQNAREDIRIGYSQSLLNLSVDYKKLSIPLAFGESETKSRIKNILKYKRPSTLVYILAFSVVFTAAFTLISNADSKGNVNGNGILEENTETSEDKNTQDIYMSSGLLEKLSENRTLYIGDNSKVMSLVYILPVLKGYEYKSIELQTKKEPYELHVYYQENQEATEEATYNNPDVQFENAVLLFTSIENMDICTFHNDSENNKVEITYKREDLEKLFGGLYSYSKTPETMQELHEKITAYYSEIYQTKELDPYKQLKAKIKFGNSDNLVSAVSGYDNNSDEPLSYDEVYKELMKTNTFYEIGLGKKISISLDDYEADIIPPPDKWEIYDYWLAEDGSVNYYSSKIYTPLDDVVTKGYTAELELSHNFASLLSSQSLPENILRGFRVACYWDNGNEASFYFILKTGK